MNLYICSTPYHLLISLVHMSINEEKSILLLTSHDDQCIKTFLQIESKLREFPFVEYFLIRKRNSFHEKLMIERVKDLYDFKKNKSIYNMITHVYNFGWSVYSLYTTSNFLYKKAQNVTLIEEGSLMFNAPKPRYITKFIKRYIYRVNTSFFMDEKVVNILVQFPEKFPDKMNKKIKKLNLEKLFMSITKEQINAIMTVFLSDEQKKVLSYIENKECIIIFTQPLSEDGFITKQKKRELYRDIVEENIIEENNLIVLKRHPRDTEIYGFDRVVEIDGSIPSELFMLLNMKFEKAIGICTSAINSINASQRINLDEDFIKKLKY